MSLDANIPAFEYTALERDHIRLLRIESTLNGIISCKLIHQSLDNAKSHHALSYCWGSDIKDHAILLNDRPLKITTNLYAALEGLHRLFEREGENRDHYVWVDAICINQDDQIEKSVQVQRMDSIYRQAERVIVWLGGEEAGSPEVMSVLDWVELNRSKENSIAATANRGFDQESMNSMNEGVELRLAESTKELKRNYLIKEEQLIAFQALLSDLTEQELKGDKLNSEGMMQMLQQTLFEHIFAPDHPFWGKFLAFMNRPWFSRVWT